jgi:hypothetical protein
MGAVYRDYLELLARRGWDPRGAPLKLSKPRKLWLVLRHGLL